MEQITGWVDAFFASTTLDETLVRYLHSTLLAQWITDLRWTWPIAETLHFAGLALLIGIIAPLDVRLMGFMNRVPIAAFKTLVPWAVAGFMTCLITGLIFLIGAPEQYIHNATFWLKVLFLAIAGINMVLFETTQRSRLRALPGNADTPLTFKVIGAVSLASWMMVLYWGRMLPFIGEAF